MPDIPFDIKIDSDGELVVNSNTNEIETVSNDDLRLQRAYNKIKSVSNNWYIDHIGANLESIIGLKCDQETAEIGKNLIVEELTKDDDWTENDIHIMAEIKDNSCIVYSIYLRTFQTENEDTVITNEIIATIDLVKGVHIRYGWEPRR